MGYTTLTLNPEVKLFVATVIVINKALQILASEK